MTARGPTRWPRRLLTRTCRCVPTPTPRHCGSEVFPETSQFWSLTTPDMCTGNVISRVMDRSAALFGKPAEDAGATAIAGLGVWPRTGPYGLTEAGRVHS